MLSALLFPGHLSPTALPGPDPSACSDLAEAGPRGQGFRRPELCPLWRQHAWNRRIGNLAVDSLENLSFEGGFTCPYPWTVFLMRSHLVYDLFCSLGKDVFLWL